MRVCLFDIEIAKAIRGRAEEPIEGIEYCGGFTDHAGCGISCVGAWDYVQERPRIFAADNMDEFREIIRAYDLLVTFNGVNFDNQVLRASGFEFGPKVEHYDLLRELWIHDGLNPDVFNPRTHGGYGLDRCVEVNFGLGKTGNGALAPVWFQRGLIGALHDYCLADIWLEKKLFDLVIADKEIINPKTGDRIKLPNPMAVHTAIDPEEIPW